MRRGQDWGAVLPGWNEWMFNEVEITFRSICLRLGRPMPLGMSVTLMMVARFDIGPGGAGGSLTMSVEFLSLEPLRVNGFSSWLPLGNF